MKNLLIVLAVTTVSFLAGGGWQLKDTSIDSLKDYVTYRAQGDDLSNSIYAAIILFVKYGGTAGVAGGLAATCVLIVIDKRKKKPSPNQAP